VGGGLPRPGSAVERVQVRIAWSSRGDQRLAVGVNARGADRPPGPGSPDARCLGDVPEPDHAGPVARARVEPSGVKATRRPLAVPFQAGPARRRPRPRLDGVVKTAGGQRLPSARRPGWSPRGVGGRGWRFGARVTSQRSRRRPCCPRPGPVPGANAVGDRSVVPLGFSSSRPVRSPRACRSCRRRRWPASCRRARSARPGPGRAGRGAGQDLAVEASQSVTPTDSLAVAISDRRGDRHRLDG